MNRDFVVGVRVGVLTSTVVAAAWCGFVFAPSPQRWIMFPGASLLSLCLLCLFLSPRTETR